MYTCTHNHLAIIYKTPPLGLMEGRGELVGDGECHFETLGVWGFGGGGGVFLFLFFLLK